MANAIIYCRYSDRPNAKDCDSNEKQEARCRAWCVAKGLKVAGVFADEAESGANADRPGLRMAIDAAKRHKATLVVYDVSRLSRNTAHALAFDAELRKGGASLASITEGFDSSVPMGRFMLTLLGAMATLYRETAAERTSRGMRERQRKGIAVCPKAPYGFRIEGKALVRDDHEQQVIDKMQGMTDKRWSARRIAETPEHDRARRPQWQTMAPACGRQNPETHRREPATGGGLWVKLNSKHSFANAVATAARDATCGFKRSRVGCLTPARNANPRHGTWTEKHRRKMKNHP